MRTLKTYNYQDVLCIESFLSTDRIAYGRLMEEVVDRHDCDVSVFHYRLVPVLDHSGDSQRRMSWLCVSVAVALHAGSSS